MTSKEALENITDWIEYFTRLDYVEPIVRGEVQQNFYEAYHKTRPELELIEKDLEELEELKKIMGAPIQDIMKRLKILDILKEFLSDANTGTGWIEINIDSNHDNLDSEEHKNKQLLIKEWLKNE